MGSGVVVITTNADGLVAGLEKASADTKKWGNDTTTGLVKSLSSIDVGSTIGKVTSGLMATGPIGIAAGAGAAIGGSLVAGFEVAVKRLGELGKISKRADTFGVSASDLQGMDKLFEKVGIEAGDADAVFAKMAKSVRDIETSVKAFDEAQKKALTGGKIGEQAAAAMEANFEAKGKIASLTKMGISISQLQGKALTEQFRVIADGINKLPRGAEQAAAAMDIFGKSGYSLLPMLQRGSAGIDEFISTQKKLGGILSDDQFKAAGRASKAWKEAKEEIHTAWEGLQNNLAITATPLIETLAKSAKPFLEDFLIPAAKWASDFADGMTRAGMAMFILNKEGAAAKAAEHAGMWDQSTQTYKEGDSFWSLLPSAKELGGVITVAWTTLTTSFGRDLAAAQDRALDKWINPPERVEVAPPPPIDPAWVKMQNEIGFANMTSFLGKNYGIDISPFKDRNLGEILGTNILSALGIDGKTGTNPWRKAEMTPPPDHPDFAGAIERGSKESYSIEMRSKYGDMGKPNTDAVKENGRKLDGVKTAVDRVGDKIAKLSDKLDELDVF